MLDAKAKDDGKKQSDGSDDPFSDNRKVLYMANKTLIIGVILAAVIILGINYPVIWWIV